MEILAEASSAKARTATARATGVTVLKEEWRAAIISRERSENSFFKEGELEKGNCPVIRNFMICMGLFPFSPQDSPTIIGGEILVGILMGKTMGMERGESRESGVLRIELFLLYEAGY